MAVPMQIRVQVVPESSYEDHQPDSAEQAQTVEALIDDPLGTRPRQMKEAAEQFVQSRYVEVWLDGWTRVSL